MSGHGLDACCRAPARCSQLCCLFPRESLIREPLSHSCPSYCTLLLQRGLPAGRQPHGGQPLHVLQPPKLQRPAPLFCRGQAQELRSAGALPRATGAPELGIGGGLCGHNMCALAASFPGKGGGRSAAGTDMPYPPPQDILLLAVQGAPPFTVAIPQSLCECCTPFEYPPPFQHASKYPLQALATCPLFIRFFSCALFCALSLDRRPHNMASPGRPLVPPPPPAGIASPCHVYQLLECCSTARRAELAKPASTFFAAILAECTPNVLHYFTCLALQYLTITGCPPFVLDCM